MQKVILITILLGFVVAFNNHEFTFEDINNKKMMAMDFDYCRAQNPDYCCFKDSVVLTVNLGPTGTTVNSFLFTGEQVGKNCNGSLTYYPVSSSEHPIKEVTYMVSPTVELVPKHTFYTQYHSAFEKNQLNWSAVFTILIGQKGSVYVSQNLYVNSTQDYSNFNKESIKKGQKSQELKDGTEDEKTSSGLLKQNILLFIFSYILFQFVL